MFESCKTSSFQAILLLFSFLNSRLSFSHRLTLSGDEYVASALSCPLNVHPARLTRADKITSDLDAIGQIANLMCTTGRYHDGLPLESTCQSATSCFRPGERSTYRVLVDPVAIDPLLLKQLLPDFRVEVELLRVNGIVHVVIKATVFFKQEIA
jgi:hypothetical protein